MNKKMGLDLVKMPLDELLAEADRVRREKSASNLELCAIINAKSGSCREDCRFCAQSSRNKTGVSAYPLISEREMLDGAQRGALAGAKMVGIVTSGKSPDTDEVDLISSAVGKFHEVGVSPCASLGEIAPEALQLLKASGLKRYHHNIETSERFFPNIASTHTFRDRIKTIQTVKNAGVEICSGGIFGLGESWEDRVDMALTLKDLEVDSVPINFLVPIAGTPLENMPVMDGGDALRVIALFRMILKTPVIKVAAGREAVLKNLQKMIFSAGANGMMVGGYLTVPGANSREDDELISETLLSWKK